MKKMFALITLISILGLITFALPQENNLPKETGLYYKKGETWSKVSNAIPSDAKQSSGLLSSKTTIIFDGANAETQLSNTQPVFYFVYPSGVEVYRKVRNFFNFGIFRVEKKSDHRESFIKTYSGMFGSSNNVDKKYGVQVNIQTVSDGLITITPVSNLAPGEYIIVMNTKGGSDGNQIFEFGVSTK